MSIKVGLEYIGYIDPWTDEERLSDEEIVRCRECKFYLEENKWCYHFEDSEFCPEPNSYCSWGKRRD